MGAFVELEMTMAPRKKQNPTRIFIYTFEIVITMLFLLLAPVSVHAQEHFELFLPNFSTFADNVQDGEAGVLKGVYVPDSLAFPIIQQPVGNPGYVSQTPDVVTQFGMAAEVGNVGLLAHNHLAGQAFTNLKIGDEVRLVYGDGKIEYFTVTQLLQYQALQPYSPYSEFRNLESDLIITAEELFRDVYRGDRHVTFQVCIAANGIDAWGRLFVIAQPKPEPIFDIQSLRRKFEYQIFN
jgi:hypothetical protein